MKKYVFSAMVFALATGYSVQANALTVQNTSYETSDEGRQVYPRKSSYRTADQMTREMSRRLNLTEEQENKVARLNKKYEEDLNKGAKADSYTGYIGQFPTKERAKLRKKGQKRRERLQKRDTKLQEILSSGQWQQYKRAKRQGAVWAR